MAFSQQQHLSKGISYWSTGEWSLGLQTTMRRATCMSSFINTMVWTTGEYMLVGPDNTLPNSFPPFLHVDYNVIQGKNAA